MKKLLPYLSVLAILISSCQKEIDFVNGGGSGGTNSGNKLVKTVAKTGSDSIVTVYTYNSSGKVINVKTTGMSGGIDQANEYRYYRNSAGIITRTVQINPNFTAAGIDSVITTVFYNSATGRYTSDVTSLSLSGFTINDSTVHVYDASGKVTEEDEYQAVVSVGQPYELTFKTKFSYDASGNTTQMDFYSHDVTTNADDLVATLKYAFDNKAAAINYGKDAIGIGQPDLASVNNILKAELTDNSDPSNNQTFDFTYSYNGNNKPATGTQTITPGGAVSNFIYYYQ